MMKNFVLAIVAAVVIGIAFGKNRLFLGHFGGLGSFVECCGKGFVAQAVLQLSASLPLNSYLPSFLRIGV